MYACKHTYKNGRRTREGEGCPRENLRDQGGHRVPGLDWTCDHEQAGVNKGGHEQVHREAIGK